MSDLIKIIECLEELASYDCVQRSERLTAAVEAAIMELSYLISDQDDCK